MNPAHLHDTNKIKAIYPERLGGRGRVRFVGVLGGADCEPLLSVSGHSEEAWLAVRLEDPGYFETNAPRMRYRWLRQCGLFVGSGVVEASKN
jgi:hypothetical protein